MVALAMLLPYLKKLYDSLTRKPHNEVLIPNNQGEFQQMIGAGSKLLKDSKSEGSVEVKGWFSRVIIVNIKGADSITKGVQLSEEGEKPIVKEVVAEKEKTPLRKVNLLPLQYGDAYTHISSKNKYTDQKILEIVNRLDKTFRNKIIMAIEIDELFKAGKKYDAESDREDFSTQYGMSELKFVDLWAQGYLKTILIKLYEVDKTNPKTPHEIEKIIREFVAYAETIFFVHKKTDIKNEILKLLCYANQNRKYIALHALGHPVEKALEIDKEVYLELKKLGYTPIVIKYEKYQFSKVWYKGDGIETYKLLLEVMPD